jgi:hypothetical protein
MEAGGGSGLGDLVVDVPMQSKALVVDAALLQSDPSTPLTGSHGYPAHSIM